MSDWRTNFDDTHGPLPILREEPLECLEAGDDCSGTVEYRIPPTIGTGRAFPRCDKHWAEALDRYEKASDLQGDTPPAWFDEADAGERWDSDY